MAVCFKAAVKTFVLFMSNDAANVFCNSAGAVGNIVLAMVQAAATRVFASLEILSRACLASASFSCNEAFLSVAIVVVPLFDDGPITPSYFGFGSCYSCSPVLRQEAVQEEVPPVSRAWVRAEWLRMWVGQPRQRAESLRRGLPGELLRLRPG